MEEPENVIIKADEVDEPPPPPEAFEAAAKDLPSSPREIVQSMPFTGEVQSIAPSNLPPVAPSRPPLLRDRATPQPQGTWIDLQNSHQITTQDANGNNANITQQPNGLWNPPVNISSDPSDPLTSLSHLRRILQDIPKLDTLPYAFKYADSSTFKEELEELFDYAWDERNSLIRASTTFCRFWDDFTAQSTSLPTQQPSPKDWHTSDMSLRKEFVGLLASRVSYGDEAEKMESLECLLHIVLGCWHETAGGELLSASSSPATSYPRSKSSESYAHISHIRSIRSNVLLLSQVIQPDLFFGVLRHAYDPQSVSRDEFQGDTLSSDTLSDIYQRREKWLGTVILYILVELATRRPGSQLANILRASLKPIQSDILNFITDIIARSRWEENDSVPSTKLLLLYWKLILLIFGGISDVEKIKNQLGSNADAIDAAGQPRITASPLDYHVFRQEIMSKYPAYDPPPPVFPFEPDNSSFLPSLQDAAGKNSSVSSAAAGAGPANIPGAGTSIMDQPVHIATPAPSPPPSPAGPGGKGLKKQNYQTNQMFPFLYPPLDESSNDLGGKGSTEMQDFLAGRKWEGSDIPASILEAADLFSKRMRATRAMKQLWQERIRFMKHEQGYSGSPLKVSPQEQAEEDTTNAESDDKTDHADDYTKLLTNDQRQKLDSVEDFYEASLPYLQSVVIVLLKTLVHSITHLLTQTDGQEGGQINGQTGDLDGHPRNPPEPQGVNGNRDEPADPSFNDLVNTRNQEITAKAVSGILILLLKWFKVSHVLKFEYLSQLLLDSNYVQLVMKLFTHQELERAVAFKYERKDLNFFEFCAANSRNATPAHASKEPDDDFDEAAPPPISMSRNQANRSAIRLNAAGIDSSHIGAPTPAPTQPPPRPPAPEVDELGYPTSDLPSEPITHYSWRTFFVAINHLRIMQKVLKSKPHRQLLMVQGKYSNTLKKHLKVPQPQIRLYTLKIIKGQVPYCHRKWRQGNMRIITAIYLHVKPGLRDEWLSGLDVEQEVGEALPAEQALRALTYWYNLSHYPNEMDAGSSEISDESDLESDLALDDLQPFYDPPEGGATDVEIQLDSVKDNGVMEGEDNKSSRSPLTGEPAASQLLQEQDFFLRELEKMDLGLSLYGVPSSVLSSSLASSSLPSISPPPAAQPTSPPPSTRMLPLPENLTSAALNDALQEYGAKGGFADGAEVTIEPRSNVVIPQIPLQPPWVTSQQAEPGKTASSQHEPPVNLERNLSPRANVSAETLAPTFFSSDSRTSAESDVILITAEPSYPPPSHVPLDTAAALDQPSTNSSGIPPAGSSAKTGAEEEEDADDEHDDDDDADSDDADVVADADVEAGESMVLAQ